MIFHRERVILNGVIQSNFFLSSRLTDLFFDNLRTIIYKEIAAVLDKISIADRSTSEWILKFIHCVTLSEVLEHHVILLSFGPSLLVVHVHHFWWPVSLSWRSKIVRAWGGRIDIVHLSLRRGLIVMDRALRRRFLRTPSRIRVVESRVMFRG